MCGCGLWNVVMKSDLIGYDLAHFGIFDIKLRSSYFYFRFPILE